MQKLPHTKSCFVCGEWNPHGLKLEFETDGRIVRSVFTPRPEHTGFKQTVHGGVLATVLDEIMSWACAVQTKQWGYCGELTVRFREPARPGQPLIVLAELVENRRGKIFEAKAQLCTQEGTTVATATGKYLPIKEPLDMEDELIGDPALILPAGR
jgi:acyl-coenzyme A thioesterase PaaI-like protein